MIVRGTMSKIKVFRLVWDRGSTNITLNSQRTPKATRWLFFGMEVITNGLWWPYIAFPRGMFPKTEECPKLWFITFKFDHLVSILDFLEVCNYFHAPFWEPQDSYYYGSGVVETRSVEILTGPKILADPQVMKLQIPVF